jgi:ABC-type antimicrobial peptide transport system permease subunit
MPLPLKYNLRSLRVRRVATILTAVGIALVTTIFVSLLGLGQGLRRTMTQTGHERNLIVLRDGPTAESQSSITREQFDALRAMPQIERDTAGEPMASPETVIVVSWVKPDGGHANVLMRGVRAAAWGLRESLRVEGRRLSPGSAEAVVGATLARRLPDLAVGKRLRFKSVHYEIVGVFSDEGSAYESEFWADLDTMMAEFGRPYSSAIVRSSDPAALARRIDADPRLQLKGRSESDYYKSQTQTATMIQAAATMMAIVLGTGACLGAAITMYASVASRVREVATLRVLGFSAWSIWLGFLLESALIAGAGGVAGAILALPVNWITTGTTNFETFTEIAWNFAVTPFLMAVGFVLALMLGVAGGLFPAIRAARIPVARALREL